MTRPGDVGVDAEAAPPPADEAPPLERRATPVPSPVPAPTPTTTIWRWRVGGGVFGAVGALPRASWGADGTAGLSSRDASFALEARFDAPTSLMTPAGKVTLWSATAWAVPCLHRGVLAACAVLGGGILRGTGDLVSAARTGTSPWFGGGLRAVIRVPISGPTAVTIHVDGLFVPLRTIVELGAPPAEVWRTPWFAGTVGLGLAYDFRSSR